MKAIKIIFLICLAAFVANASSAQGCSQTRVEAKMINIVNNERSIIIIDDESVRSKSDVLLVYNARLPSLRNIYEKYYKLKPGFSGIITLKSTIDAKGKVSSIEIIESNTDYDKFDKAIKDKIATWKWKPIEKGNVTVTVRIMFDLGCLNWGY